jgi:hypothetical protein
MRACSKSTVGKMSATNSSVAALRSNYNELSSFLADASCLADTISQVVEPSSAHVAAANYLDLVDARGVYEKCPLDADAMRYSPDRDVLVGTASCHFDHRPFEHLDALTVPLDHPNVDTHRVAGKDVWKALFHVLLTNALENHTHGSIPKHEEEAHGVASPEFSVVV